MKVALVYDRINKWGGAERVLLALHELFPDAPLYTAVYSPDSTPWAEVFPRIVTSYLQHLPGAKNNHEFLGALTPSAFESFDFSGYDLVISVTSESAKGVITKPDTVHMCYCLTPTRYLWSGREEYLKNPGKPGVIPFYNSLSKPILNYVRKWDFAAASRPDYFLSISTEVNSRIKRYYQRDSEIVFPPVDKLFFKTDVNKNSNIPDNYYLSVGRLIPYKRMDLVITTFNKLRLPLVIVGTGSEEKKLKSIAKDNIYFSGFVDNEDLLSYYHYANALVFPQEEDFGIVPLEAMASGTPVIAFQKGGVLDTVVDGSTGVLFKEQTPDSLIEAIVKLRKLDISKSDCRKQAQKFTIENFKSKFNNLINKYAIG